MALMCVNDNIVNYMKTCGVSFRPKTTSGIWLSVLLPFAIIISALNHPVESSTIYKLCAVLCVGLILTIIITIVQCLQVISNFKLQVLHGLCFLITSLLFHLLMHKGIIFSLMSGFWGNLVFYNVFLYILREFKYGFTFGEAAVASQSLIIFLYSACLNIYKTIEEVPYKILDVSVLIINVGLLGIFLLILLCYNISIFRRPAGFYTLFLMVIIFAILLPLQILMRSNPLVWMVTFFIQNGYKVKLFSYWFLCSFACYAVISRQVQNAKKASTVHRKVFHILALLVFVPGLLNECTMLYLSTGVVMGIFLCLELIRILDVPPLGPNLQEGYLVFCDEKDAGLLALTPIYLLVGCSLPLWIHPAPCDITDSAGFYLLPLLSGLLTIGVGDTCASIFGTLFGMHRWPNSKKTVEGTIACVLSQVVCVFILVYLGLIVRGHMLLLKSLLGIVLTSLVEAKTTQVDNLALPLIMYICLLL